MVEVLAAQRSETQQRRVAAALSRAGLRAGDRVAVSLPPSPALLAVVLGALRSGVVPVLLDPALPAAERAELLADCRPALVVAGAGDAHRLLDTPPLAAAELADVPLARPMHYTSGTTGRRKGVWSGVLAEPAARALLREEVDLWGFAADDRHLVVSTLHHSAPLRFAAGTLLAGGTVLLPGPFDPAHLLDVAADYRPTTTFCVPTHLKRLIAAGGGELPRLPSFRLLAHAGEPCPDEVKRRVLAALPAGSVHEFYGSTEGQFTACTTAEWLDRPGTVGRARPGRELVLDADGTIWCAVPEHARFSYWDDPGKTAAAWRGSRFTVGDTGRLDPDGYLYLDGRRSDLIITGGVNVYPLEVERVLAGHPGVDEVAVFGVDDEHWGQRVCAAVTGEVAVEQLADFARDRLGAAKRPKEYHLVPELPRNANGKVVRTDLARALGLS